MILVRIDKVSAVLDDIRRDRRKPRRQRGSGIHNAAGSVFLSEQTPILLVRQRIVGFLGPGEEDQARSLPIQPVQQAPFYRFTAPDHCDLRVFLDAPVQKGSPLILAQGRAVHGSGLIGNDEGSCFGSQAGDIGLGSIHIECIVAQNRMNVQ
jgi:hypothetical protein